MIHCIFHWIIQTMFGEKNYSKKQSICIKLLGLNEKDTKGIIEICQELLLNNSYWFVKEDYLDIFSDKNLYINSFNTKIASITFTR